MIIVEGKKEEVAKKLKQRFEYDGPFIDRMMLIDPTGYKYVDYIGKKLEKIIPELAGSKGGLNIGQQEAIQDVLGVVIPWFNTNFDRITEEDVWKAETNYRDKFGIVPNIEGISKSPRDINQYENPEFIKYLMDIVDSKKSAREIEKELKSQVEKIYEDEDVLVVRPMSYAASCYYGANTKWCTTTKGSSGYFDKHFSNGKLYYFLNKKTNVKSALFIDNDRKVEVYDSSDRLINLDDLRKEFPQQTDLIDELSGVGSFIKILRDYARGNASRNELYSDPLISDTIPEEPLGQTRLIIEFDNDDKFLETIGLNEDDIWFANMINSYYSDYEFMDSYQTKEDFKDGYVIYGELTDENIGLLKQIAEFVYPEKTFNIDDDTYRIQLNEKLLALFPDEIDSIIDDYAIEKNREMFTVAKETIESEINGLLENSGFELYRGYEKIQTTVGNLLMWSARLGINKTNMSSLFEKIISENGSGNIGGWHENSYEFQNPEYFDSKSFNNEVTRQFDKILEEIESDSEEKGIPIKEFLDFRNRILKKFKPEQWYKLPKDKNVSFRIEGFDRDDMEVMKVIVRLESKTRGYRTIAITEENFYNLLYQPGLFDADEL